MTEPNWWAELYDDQLADVLLDSTDAADDAATVAFLIDTLRLERGSRVFDQCAGTGRLSIPLARWGARVVGVEQAARYVERARARAREAGVDATFVCGDAFEVVPDPPCDAALNWWTSFGYLPDDAGNARMLRRAFEALVPGGRFALDYPNVPNLYAAWRPQQIDRRTVRGEQIVLLRESELDLANGLLHKRWTFAPPSGRRSERRTTIRLYAPDRLAALVASVGFSDIRLLGGISGGALALDSPRCIVVARRP